MPTNGLVKPLVGKKSAIPSSGRNHEFALHSHSCLVDGLADDVRKMYAALGLFSGEHIADPGEPQDYTGKLVILRDTALKEECRTPENQLFLAESGFGCAPEKVGKKVFGRRKRAVLPPGYHWRNCV